MLYYEGGRVTWWTMRGRVTWWTMREEGDMVDYAGEGDTDLFSLQSLKRGTFYCTSSNYSLCVANYKFV